MNRYQIRSWAFALFVALSPVTACSLVAGPSKVAKGQLYTSGDTRYDAYFESVHREQVAAASWPDESKAARKPIVSALNLAPSASNYTIVSSTKEKKGAASIGRAVEETSSSETELARKLNAAADKLEEMKKKGEELRKQAAEERSNMGANKADEKKVEHKDQIKRELAAAVDVTSDLASDARKGAKEAEELASKLRAAYDGGDGSSEHAKKQESKPPPPKEKDDEPKPPPKKPKPEPAVAKKHEKKSDEKKADEKKSDEKKADEKKPAPKPPDEVFNP